MCVHVRERAREWQHIADRLVTVCLPRMHLSAVHMAFRHAIIIKPCRHTLLTSWPFIVSVFVSVCADWL